MAPAGLIMALTSTPVSEHCPHGLVSCRFDVSGDLVVGEGSVYFGKAVPDSVQMRQHFAFLDLLEAQVIFIGDKRCFGARAGALLARTGGDFVPPDRRMSGTCAAVR